MPININAYFFTDSANEDYLSGIRIVVNACHCDSNSHDSFFFSVCKYHNN